MWLGKIIGAVLGFMLIRNPIGVLLGLFVGNFFDRGYLLNARAQAGAHSETQATFFRTTFQVMGHIAKADGQVSKREIQIVEDIMRRMNLNATQREAAIAYFNEGKSADFNLESALQELHQHLRHQRILMQFFIEVQFQLAMAEGMISPNTQKILALLCQRLGVAPMYQRFESIFGQQSGGYQQNRQFNNAPPINEDYTLFNLTKDCTEKDLKTAYRRAMKQNHPDKLIAQGLPEQMIKLATEKTQRLQAAYERIKNARGW